MARSIVSIFGAGGAGRGLGRGSGSDLDLEALAVEMDQIWAEAVACLNAGETWFPEGDKDQWFLDAQDQCNEKWILSDPWQYLIQEYALENGKNGLPMKQMRGASWILQHVLKKDIGQFSQIDQNRITAMMKNLKYKNKQIWENDKNVTGYVFEGNTEKPGWWAPD